PPRQPDAMGSTTPGRLRDARPADRLGGARASLGWLRRVSLPLLHHRRAHRAVRGLDCLSPCHQLRRPRARSAWRLAPAAVYNHPDGIAHPWKWAGIHGLFVLGASAANLATWRLNELTRARTGLILNSAGEGIYGLDLGG